jgi:hypothetical protein
MNENTNAVEATEEDVLIDEVSDGVLERAGLGGPQPVTATLWVVLSACCC